MADNAAQEGEEIPFDKLYPALIECFGVIICGYIAGRVGVIKEQQTGGLATFVGTFSLPCLIFLSLATLDLSVVNWYFLLSVFISKAIVFASVLFVTLLVTRPVEPGKAGLYAIFCTQSNDFAIGYPIVTSVYKNFHPDFISYLYLLAPINLIMLNPIGFALMEISKNKATPTRSLLPLRILGSIASNPIVFMSAFGIIGNLVFAHQVPDGLYELLNVFGSAFTASALFLLGFRMVGSVRNFKGEALMVPICLIAAKELMLPLVTREVSSLILTWAQSPTNETAAYSNYGFLYSTLPSAPGVFVYSTTYGLEVNLIATAMVACTFVSAPLMFMSAKLVSVSHLSPAKTISTLASFDLDLSIVGIFSCAILLGVFAFKQAVWSAPHKLTMCLVLSQLIGCVGIIIRHIYLPYALGIAYTLTIFGEYSSRILAACLAICLAFMESRNYATVNNLLPIFYGTSVGIPIVLIIISCILDGSFPPPERTTLSKSTAVETIDILLLLVTLIVGVVYMILQQRYKRRYARYLVYSREANATCESIYNCADSTTPKEDQPIVAENTELDGSTGCEDSHPIHHLALVFFLINSIFLSLALHIWNVVDDGMGGIYLELAFLDSFFTRGQSLIVFFIFGLEIISLMQPFYRRFMDRFSQDSDSIVLPSVEEIPSETQHLCDQFSTYHVQPCQSQIVKRRRLKLWDFVVCFTGEDLVSWLLSQGLVKDREEGVVYGSHLLTGRVLRHINNSQYFTDDVSLFVFNTN